MAARGINIYPLFIHVVISWYNGFTHSYSYRLYICIIIRDVIDSIWTWKCLCWHDWSKPLQTFTISWMFRELGCDVPVTRRILESPWSHNEITFPNIAFLTISVDNCCSYSDTGVRLVRKTHRRRDSCRWIMLSVGIFATSRVRNWPTWIHSRETFRYTRSLARFH